MLPKHCWGFISQVSVLGVFVFVSLTVVLGASLPHQDRSLVSDIRTSFTSCESYCETKLQTACNSAGIPQGALTCLCDDAAPARLENCLKNNTCSTNGVLLNWWEKTCGKTTVQTTSVSSIVALPSAAEFTPLASAPPTTTQSAAAGNTHMNSIQVGSILIGIAIGAVFIILCGTAYLLYRRRKRAAIYRHKVRKSTAVEDGLGRRKENGNIRGKSRMRETRRSPQKPTTVGKSKNEIPAKRSTIRRPMNRPNMYRPNEIPNIQNESQDPKYALPRPPESALLSPPRPTDPSTFPIFQSPKSSVRFAARAHGPSSQTLVATTTTPSPAQRIQSVRPMILHTEDDCDSDGYETSTISTSASTDGHGDEDSTILSTSAWSDTESQATRRSFLPHLPPSRAP